MPPPLSASAPRTEQLLRVALFQVVYGTRSDRHLMDRLDHDLLLRWFAGLPFEAPGWTQEAYAAARAAMLSEPQAARLLPAVLAEPRVQLLLQDDRFAPDGAMLARWEREASQTAEPAEPPRVRVSPNGWIESPPRRVG